MTHPGLLIDAHIHLTPPELAAQLPAFAEQEPYWGLLLGTGAADGAASASGHPTEGRPTSSRLPSVQGWATAERMIADMNAAGVDKVILMGEYRQRHEHCVERNNQALDIIRRWPDRVIAFAVLQPLAGQAALDEMARCLDGGMAGVGELGPYGQGYRLDHPAFLRLVEACIRHNIPLNLHTNEEVGRWYPGKATTPLLHYYRLAGRYPELKLILSHWGGGLFFYELMPEARRTLRNVSYDTAASPLLYATRDIFDVALRCVDHRKLLYASDYPLLLYPRRQAEPDFRPYLAEITALGLTHEIQADILGDNAARLLKLTPDHRAEAPPARPHPPLQPLGSDIDASIPLEAPKVGPLMAVSAVVSAWPQTAAVFESYGIPWDDTPVPYWEPILQAASARGLGSEARERLLRELNEAIR